MEEFEQTAQIKITEKGPDFLSRLKGFINVNGPNPVIPFCERTATNPYSGDDTAQSNLAKNVDPEHIIRRAILINSLIQIGYRHLFKNDVLQIDDGVLNAFLLIPKFKHGTRSIETILKTSQLSGKEKFHRSDLPPESQMNLHVDGQQFFEFITQEPKYLDGGKAFYFLVNEISFDVKVVEKMAACIHAMYSLAFSLEEGRDMLSITKEEFKASYDKMQTLPEGMPQNEVSQNYHNARTIPEKLKAVGYAIVPIDADLMAEELRDEGLEKVSRLEHIRWVRHNIDAGWSYAPEKQKSFKLHDALVAWDEEERQAVEQVYGKYYAEKMGTAKGEVLSEYYRNLDRLVSLAIPWVLEIAGYKMVKVR